MKNQITHLAACAALILAAIFCQSTTAQTQKKTIVRVSHAGEDLVGKRLAFSVKEAIRASSSYQLEDTKNLKFSAYNINVVTIDPESNTDGNNTRTAASVTFSASNTSHYDPKKPQTYYPIYITSMVITSGSSRVEEAGKSILPSLEEAIEEYKKTPQ